MKENLFWIKNNWSKVMSDKKPEELSWIVTVPLAIIVTAIVVWVIVNWEWILKL